MKTKKLTIITLAFILLSFSNNATQKAESVFDSYAIKLTQAEYNTLTTAYSTANATKTWGGRINKYDMQDVINSLGEENTLFFHFANNSEGKTFTMFKGGTINQSNGEDRIIQNTGSSKCFCPPKCAIQTSDFDVTTNINLATFNSQKQVFESGHSGETYGGSISKNAMQSIINSLEGYSNINFRYCTDASSGNTSLILIGGTHGQAGNEMLFIRNGGSPDSFCPTYCR